MSGWHPISTFDRETMAGKSYLGWFPQCRCVFDMVWGPNYWAPKSEPLTYGFHPFGSDGRFKEQPSHWMEMPEPPE